MQTAVKTTTNKQPRVRRLKARDDMERNEYMREYFKKPENKERHKRAVYKSHAKIFAMQFATRKEMEELMNIFEEENW